MSKQKNKLVKCMLYSIHTKNTLTVSLERKEGGYAILNKKNKVWHIVMLPYKKSVFSRKFQKITVFKKPLGYYVDFFITSKLKFISRKSFFNFKKINYFDAAETGWIPERYLK